MTISVDRNVRVAMPDGVRLAADVFRPAGGGRHPVVLLRTPYDRSGAAAFGLQLNALHLVDAGYVVVTQDVRGRFGSEGEFEPFRSEAADGVATIHWAAEQPWSSGVVAMAGMSYCGYAQVLAARERPEPLRAWIPAFCPLDARTEWVDEGGASNLAFNLALSLASFAAPDRRTEDPAAVLDTLDDWQASVRRGADEQPELLATAAGRSAYGAWREHQGDPGWWAPLSGRGAGAHNATALVVGGWFDIFHHGTMALHAELAAGRARSTHLLLGPWDHSPLPLSSGSGDSEFGWRAIVDLPALSMAWLDHVLRDGPSPLARAARTFATGANYWLDWDSWPPPDVEVQVLSTAPDGSLTAVAPAPGMSRFRFDAADPTPNVGGRTYPRPRQMRPGQMDQGRRSARPDVLGFAAEPASRDLLIAGLVRAEIWSGAAADATSVAPGGSAAGAADIAATLVDVAPDGRALNIAEGVRRRRDVGAEPVCFEVDLGHVAHVVRRGHRLRLDIAAAAFPRVNHVPQRGSVERTIAHGGATPSGIILPIVGGAG